jgi:hypothetical protein
MLYLSLCLFQSQAKARQIQLILQQPRPASAVTVRGRVLDEKAPQWLGFRTGRQIQELELQQIQTEPLQLMLQ